MTEKKKTGLIKGMKTEFKKVVWPTKQEIINSTLVVVVSIIGIAVAIKLIDMVLRLLLKLFV